MSFVNGTQQAVTESPHINDDQQLHLLQTCCQLLDCYDSSLSPQVFIEKIIPDQAVLSGSAKKFIADVFFGVCDNESVVSVVVNGYYAKEGKNCLKSERSLYSVIAYMILYRVKLHGVDDLHILFSHPLQEKILKFCKYFLNDKNLHTWMKDAWTTHYDKDYVERFIVNPLLDLLPELHELLRKMEKKVYTVSVKQKPFVTNVKPFNLTEVSKKSVLLPEILVHPAPVDQLPRRVKCEKATQSGSDTDDRSDSDESLDRMEKKNSLNESKKKYRRQTGHRTLDFATEAKNAETKLKPFKATPFHVVQNEKEPIKLNTAAVLKDEFIIKRQEEHIMKQFAFLESGDRNSVEFMRWQNAMRQNDLQKKQDEVQRKILESKLSYEEAIQAKAKLAEAKKQRVKQLQAQKSRALSEHAEKARLDVEKKSNLVKETIEDEKKVKLLKAQLVTSKKEIAQQVIKETEEKQQIALKEIENEMRKKIELIQQIKAAESISLNKTKLVDLTSSAGHGLLLEMSIVELKERVEIMRQLADETNKRRHDEIVLCKMQKDQALLAKLYYINNFRNESTGSEKKLAKSNSVGSALAESVRTEAVACEATDPSLSEMKSKLEEIKRERAKAKQLAALSRPDTKRQFQLYSSQRKALESNRYKEIESTHERYRLLK